MGCRMKNHPLVQGPKQTQHSVLQRSHRHHISGLKSDRYGSTDDFLLAMLQLQRPASFLLKGLQLRLRFCLWGPCNRNAFLDLETEAVMFVRPYNRKFFFSASHQRTRCQFDPATENVLFSLQQRLQFWGRSCTRRCIRLDLTTTNALFRPCPAWHYPMKRS